jgi:phosphohistidine swiveling domain-containing protein
VHELGVAVSLVAARVGMSEKDLMMLSPQEVHERKFLDKAFREEIKERAKYSLVVYFTDPEPHCKVFFGEKNKKMIHHILEEKNQDNLDSIYGTCVSTGRAVGRVSICRNLQEINAFEEGNVLVASMTRPEYLPAMKKAVAIITDEGGLTSHAAIVARELGVPCIVGVRGATKRIKDGDSIEVDANKGQVNILEKAVESSNGMTFLQVADYLRSHKIDFQNANCPLFSPDYVFPAYVNSDSVHGFNFSPNFAYYLNGNFYQVMPNEVIMGVARKTFFSALKNPAWYKAFLKSHLSLEKKAELIWKKLSPITRLSNNDLYSCFIELAELGRKWWMYASVGEDKGLVIEEQVLPVLEKNHGLTKSEANEVVSILSHPKREAIFTAERKEFFKICLSMLCDKKLSSAIKSKNKPESASLLLKNKKLGRLFKEYKKKYFYSKTSFSYGKEMLLEDFVIDLLEEIKGMSVSDLRKELNGLEREAQKIKAQKKKISSKIKLSVEEKKMICFSSLFSEWLDYRKRGMMKQFYYLFCILHEYEKRMKIPFEDLMLLSYEEMKKVLSGEEKINYSELNKRKEPFFAVYEKGSWKGDFYYGEAGAELYKLALGTADNFGLKGNVASKGANKEKIISGVARIVINPSKDEFNEGEILVASMTRIEFVPLMRKAKAIITDEGGIACHAAIVSRELGVPCIIGTKNATSRIKNGEKIELDLEKGEIRLI